MTATQMTRHSDVLAWMLIYLLAVLLVLVALTRVAAATAGELPEKPVETYIVSPGDGVFVAGAYRGAEPYVSAGSQLEPSTVVGNVEIWGRLQPVYSMLRGTVVEVLVGDEAVVVTGQPLFTVQSEPEPPV